MGDVISGQPLIPGGNLTAPRLANGWVASQRREFYFGPLDVFGAVKRAEVDFIPAELGCGNS